MKKQLLIPVCFSSLFFVQSCNNTATPIAQKKDTAQATEQKGSFAYDAAFLRKYTRNTIELHDSTGNSRILLSADYQGRVMTSASTGEKGSSYGWVNYKLLAAREKQKQFNPVGGEERLWLGPEGGQYGLYFKKGDSFSISHWQVPAIFDTIPFYFEQAGDSKCIFHANASLTNYSGSHFDVGIERTVTIFSKHQSEQQLGFRIPGGVQSVVYRSENKITNTGSNNWKEQTGVLSIWLLGMMIPGNETKVIVPFEPVPNAAGQITKNYFGDIPAERFWTRDSFAFFVCDGKWRSKIGISPLIAKPVAGSFDAQKNILTIIIFEISRDEKYVNSKWELQKQPYNGDVMNSYNDGPLADGSQMGPFYEIESSSPAQALKSGESRCYHQVTCHFEGAYSGLREIAKNLLGIDLESLKK